MIARVPAPEPSVTIQSSFARAVPSVTPGFVRLVSDREAALRDEATAPAKLAEPTWRDAAGNVVAKPAARVATYAYVNPVVAVLLGAWLADEPLSARVVLAAVIIIGGVAAILSGQKRTSVPADERNDERPDERTGERTDGA